MLYCKISAQNSNKTINVSHTIYIPMLSGCRLMSPSEFCLRFQIIILTKRVGNDNIRLNQNIKNLKK